VRFHPSTHGCLNRGTARLTGQTCNNPIAYDIQVAGRDIRLCRGCIEWHVKEWTEVGKELQAAKKRLQALADACKEEMETE
jgi:hypothetical protein